MGFLGNIFGNGSKTDIDDRKVPWRALENLNQLDEIETNSHKKAQLIFKHSTTCGISRMVLNMFSSNSVEPNRADTYLLDLHAYRNVSNRVAEKFGVMHQSPQLLIIKNGEVVHHSSHGAITDVALEQVI